MSKAFKNATRNGARFSYLNCITLQDFNQTKRHRSKQYNSRFALNCFAGPLNFFPDSNKVGITVKWKVNTLGERTMNRACTLIQRKSKKTFVSLAILLYFNQKSFIYQLLILQIFSKPFKLHSSVITQGSSVIFTFCLPSFLLRSFAIQGTSGFADTSLVTSELKRESNKENDKAETKH